MKKVIFSIIAIAAFVVIPMSVNAQVTATAGDNVSKAQIVTTIAIENVNVLDFGSISGSVTAAGATIVLSPLGVITDPSTFHIAGTQTAATFNVTGSQNATYSITLPDEDVALTGTTNAQTLTVNAFESNPSGSGKLSAAGTQTFSVGASLVIPITATADYYAGVYDVTVAYN